MTKRKTLSTVVAEKLVEKINSGGLKAGMQLPTEAELCAEFDVSRTVIREAVARLRSEGLVIPQQGRGMFVSNAPAPRNFTIPDDALKSLPETIALLELRLSVEVESAGLCAERRTDGDAAAIRTLMEQIDAQQNDPGATQIHYDYDFHLAIAKATRNDLIYGFLVYLRPMIVPRLRLGYLVPSSTKHIYYARVHNEHSSIVEAIEKRDGRGARNAMRKHLHNSLERLRALAESSGVNIGEPSQSATAASLFPDLKGP